MGPQAAARALLSMAESLGRSVLVVGLGGGLSESQRVGDLTLYRDCLDLQSPTRAIACDGALTAAIARRLQARVAPVRGLTSDRLIYQVTEKQKLHQRFGAVVVDMEGAAILRCLGDDRAVAMLRAISDDCRGDWPDLSAAISPDGRLLPLPIAAAFLRQPRAALRAVEGSLRGLAVLQATVAALFAPSDLPHSTA